MPDEIAELKAKLSAWEQLAAEKNWGYVHDQRYDDLLERVRSLEAALAGVLMENGHSAGCLAGNRVSLPCAQFCQDARAILAVGVSR